MHPTDRPIPAQSDIVLILNHQRQIVWANRCLLDAIKQKNIADYLGFRPGDVFHCVNAMTSEHGCGTAKACQVCGALLAILQSLDGHGADEECMLLTTENDTLNLRFKACLIEVDGLEFDAVSIVDISGEKNKRMLERLFFHDIMNLAGSIQGFTDLLPENQHQLRGIFFAVVLQNFSTKLYSMHRLQCVITRLTYWN